jgi:hypothetical protein
MSHDEMIAVIAHHQNGGKVEYRGRSEITWWPVMSDPLWNFASHDYRIKPEPRSLWVVRYQGGNIAGTYTDLVSAESRSRHVTNATIHEYKEVLP